MAHLRRHRIPDPFFHVRRSPCQYDLQAEPLHGVIGHRRIAFGAPVARNAGRAGAQGQRSTPGRHLLGGEVAVGPRQGDVPDQVALLDAQRLGKPKQPVHHVLALPGPDALIGEKPLPVTGPRPVETDAPVRSDKPADDAGPQRGLHVQEHVEPAPGQLSPETAQPGEPLTLVEYRELDSGQIGYKHRFHRADDPRDPGTRQGAPQGIDHGHGVADVADGRKAQNAEVFGLISQGDSRLLGGAHPS